MVRECGENTHRPSPTSRTINLTVLVETESAVMLNAGQEVGEDEDEIGHYSDTEAETVQAEAQYRENEKDVSTNPKYLI